jgi:hydrogenase-4 component E
MQGALLGALPLLLHREGHSTGHALLLAGGALVVKGWLIPWLMFRAIREASIRREMEPIIGFVPSMVLGGIGVALAFAFSSRMPLPGGGAHPFLVPTALSTVWAGLLLVVSRRKAVTQVLGFLVLENGVFVFGLLLSGFMPIMVEAGVLLDLFAAVFVMGIVMFHINREFSSLDTEKLSALKD